MISEYTAIKDLIGDTLDNNTNGIVFETTLYHTNTASDYIKRTNSTENNYEVIEQKVVPVHIVEIVGDYINVPDTEVIDLNIALEFDIFTRSYLTLEAPKKQELWQSADYNGTLNAISEMKKALLAKRFPLGEKGLAFGGTSSSANFTLATPINAKTIYLKVDLTNNDSESIFQFSNLPNLIAIGKDDTNIILTSVMSGDTKQVTVPYTLGVTEIWAWYDASNNWNLKVGSSTDNIEQTATQAILNFGQFSTPNAYEGVLYQLLIDDSVITLSDTENTPESVLTAPLVNLKDFDDRYTLNQDGSTTITTQTVTDCLTWGSLGNVVFGFETLIPIDNVRYQDEGQPRQLFGMIIKGLLSKDIIFGNSTEYFIKENDEADSAYTQIYPIDRQHTYGTETNSVQYINDKFGTSIVEKNLKDLTNTFYYRRSKRLQKLLEQTTKNEEEQNKVYNLKVQFPFHSVEYDVIIDSGGTNPNINTLQTLTITYKQKDDSLT